MTRKGWLIVSLLLTMMLCWSAVLPGASALSIVVPDTAQAPVSGQEAVETCRYGKTTKSGVNIRSTALTGSKSAGQIANKGTAVIVVEETNNSAGESWYAIQYKDTEGYIRSDLIELIDEQAYHDATTKQSSASSGGSSKKGNGSSSGATSSSGGSSKSSSSTNTETTGSGVWIPTNGGTKYHSSSSCSNMKGPRQASASEAKGLGFTACKKCW